ncbi:MAG: hypothetical protein KIH01_08165 [Candidatus Freyarchaeota archaeon]|nr:hypothetical protein [Candidatus Jordarchaeia archaeon]
MKGISILLIALSSVIGPYIGAFIRDATGTYFGSILLFTRAPPGVNAHRGVRRQKTPERWWL